MAEHGYDADVAIIGYGPSGVAAANALTDPRHLRLDVQRAPLVAAYLAHDSQTNEWLLALLNHHIVCDHLTLEFIITEIHTLLQGQGETLPASMAYRNFIAQTQAVSPTAHEAGW